MMQTLLGNLIKGREKYKREVSWKEGNERKGEREKSKRESKRKCE